MVTEGQVLARLDDSDAQRRLAAARTARDATAAAALNLEVNLANAEREAKRQQDLQKDDFTTVQALDNARTAVESLRAQIAATEEQVKAADAEIAVAQQDVDNCTVRAPFAGVVVSKDAQLGEMVSPISAGGGFTRTGIATIVDMASLEIEVDVNESYIARVRSGTAGRRRARRLPGLAHPGERADRHPDRRPAEGHRQGAHLLRRARPPDPARHGRQGVVPRRREARERRPSRGR